MLVLAAVTGCGSDETSGSAANDATADGSADAAGDTTTTDAASTGGAIPAQLQIDGATAADATTWLPAGAYASRQHFATRIQLPPFGDPAESLQTALVLHRVRHEAGKVLVETSACAIDEPAQNGVQTVFPDALIQSLGSWTTQAQAWTRSDGSTVVDLLPATSVFGCTLAAPEVDALPTQADDPRLTDPDGDGHPGGTVQLQGLISGSIYVVQRNVEHLRGRALAPGQLDGVLLGHREQKVVGASEPVLATFDLASTKHEDTARSDLIWRPLPAGDDCAAVISAAPTLFAAP